MSQARTTSTTTENEKQQPFSLAYPLTQVVSDIDDTLKSSGGVQVAGVTLGGVDVQYDRGDFYPGVFQFMWELSSYSVTLNQRYAEFRAEKAGMKNESLDTRMSPPKVAVLTARAEEFKVYGVSHEIMYSLIFFPSLVLIFCSYTPTKNLPHRPSPRTSCLASSTVFFFEKGSIGNQRRIQISRSISKNGGSVQNKPHEGLGRRSSPLWICIGMDYSV